MIIRSIAYFADFDSAGSRDGGGIVGEQIGNSWRRMLATACATIFLIGTEEIARIKIPHPEWSANASYSRLAGNQFPARKTAALAHSRKRHDTAKCAGCGSITGKREIYFPAEPGGALEETHAQPATYYEFTVRMPDGSSRIISDANPQAWREGEHVSIIEGKPLTKG